MDQYEEWAQVREGRLGQPISQDRQLLGRKEQFLWAMCSNGLAETAFHAEEMLGPDWLEAMDSPMLMAELGVQASWRRIAAKIDQGNMGHPEKDR